MAVGLTPRSLGFGLQNIVAGDQPPIMPPAPQRPGFLQEGGMGRHIAGAIGDVLLHYGGMQPVYAPMQREQQRSAQEEAQWSRRRQQANEDWTSREQWKAAHPDASPMMRDVQAWQGMTPEQRAAYEAIRKAQAGDPDVTVSLPNGQFYAGPRSGLSAAITGGMAPSAQPTAPVGKLRPIGGSTPTASGGFPDPMKAPGRMTSGRRTVEGNRAVDGVPNSYHLTGDAADYVGASAAQLRQYFGPGVKIIPEGDHNHVQGRGMRVPYFGRNGTRGNR